MNATAVCEAIAWISGSVLIGFQFGWRVGVAVWLLTWFLKAEISG